MAQDEAIRLKGQKPIASGSKRLVFAHPDFGDRLIKVLDPLIGKRKSDRCWRFFGLWRARRQLASELRQYDALLAGGLPSFLPRYHGFADTDLGPGLVVEKIADGTGGLAPTLSQLLGREGAAAEIAEALERLIAELRARQAVVGDLGPGNIVWTRRHGAGALFVIDGLGSRTLIPLIEMSRAANRSSLERRVTRLRALVDRHRTDRATAHEVGTRPREVPEVDRRTGQPGRVTRRSVRLMRPPSGSQSPKSVEVPE